MIALSQIEVKSENYRWTHGHSPKGKGQWAFAIGCTVREVEADITKAWWSKPFTLYSDAVKEAKKEAQRRGVYTIYVLS